MPEAPPRVDRRRVFQSLRMAEELTPAEQATLIAGLEALRDELMATLQLQGDNAKPVELDQAATGRISRDLLDRLPARISRARLSFNRVS